MPVSGHWCIKNLERHSTERLMTQAKDSGFEKDSSGQTTLEVSGSNMPTLSRAIPSLTL